MYFQAYLENIAHVVQWTLICLIYLICRTIGTMRMKVRLLLLLLFANNEDLNYYKFISKFSANLQVLVK